jgi:omega-amidase
MATLSTNSAPPFKPFRLALVQMGGITSSKEKNLVHAKELIARAASPPGNGGKPGVIVLPVGIW